MKTYKDYIIQRGGVKCLIKFCAQLIFLSLLMRFLYML